MKKEEIKNKLKTCFLKCAEGRRQLRKCVVNAMDSGLTKQDVLDISDELADGSLQDEAPLCSITAIGQALQYEEKQKKSPIKLTTNEKEEIKNKLKQCFKKCGLARRQLRNVLLMH